MLISSWNDLVKNFPELARQADRPEVDAIREYLKSGGIIKVADGKDFKIVYPTRKMIDERISALRKQRAYFLKQVQKLRSLERELVPVRLAFDSLYLRHQLKLLADRDYREAFRRLGFSWEHFLDPRTRKIIKQFMDDPDYRSRVLQALDESPVYRSRRFGSISDAYRNTRRELINRKVKVLQKKVEHLERQITMLSLLKRWM
ncbi:TPA: hypothetical protein EYP13_05330 [Candidatus Micrarchaeota archaeon]|nr:hypothetical protein [Candidatus Micrarchaeota archaeon]